MPNLLYIVGHSCGLSDRVLLKTVFENPKCENIFIFHHGKNLKERDKDYFYKTIQIARHFKNKALMRKKVKSFNQYLTLDDIKKDVKD